MDPEKNKPSPNKGFSRYSMAKENLDSLKSAEARTNALKSQFDSFNTNEDVTYNEVKEFLDYKVRDSEQEFDEEILEGIFQNIELGDNGKVSKEEFCSSYIGAMNFIEEAIYTTKDKIADVKRLKQDYEKQFQIASQTEVKNKYGIMKDSVLTVRVIQASDLIPKNYGGNLNPYCLLELEDQVIETSVKEKTLSPIWNESFTFSIETGKEILKVSILNKDSIKEDDFEGFVEINISDLGKKEIADFAKSQQIDTEQRSNAISFPNGVEKWYDLQPPPHAKQNEWKGKINLNLWWVYSKVDMLKDLMIN